MHIKKLSGLSALVLSSTLASTILFSSPSHAYNHHRHSNFNNNHAFSDYPTINNPNQPYFNNYHPQDDSSNRQSNLNGNTEDFPLGFAALTIAMLATMYFMTRKGKSVFNS